MFSEPFVHFLVNLGLIWTGAGAILLLVLLVIDFKNGRIW